MLDIQSQALLFSHIKLSFDPFSCKQPFKACSPPLLSLPSSTLPQLKLTTSSAGLVRAGLFTTFLQVASRVTIIWGVVHRYPAETGPLPFYSSMLTAWSLAEIIRYSYLAQHLRGEVPAALTWLRYVI
jgi:Protein tyrosine phosphatase-like protein, PTPLA